MVDEGELVVQRQRFVAQHLETLPISISPTIALV